jgi:polyferredoxin
MATSDPAPAAAPPRPRAVVRRPQEPLRNPFQKERSFHRIRKRVHAACVLVFIALPLTNLMRFDIPRQRFYFAGSEIWISEFAILFFTLMFLMFLVAAGAMIWGRVYCGYLCPQMIFSEASI